MIRLALCICAALSAALGLLPRRAAAQSEYEGPSARDIVVAYNVG